jgi:hypothetical protein
MFLGASGRSLTGTFRGAAMRRWDRLQDAYMEEYGARGLSRETVAYTEARLDR